MALENLPADGSRAHFAPVLPELPDNGKPTARLHFDSLAELAAMIPAKPPAKLANRSYWAGTDEGFYGSTKNMAEALTLARDGWQEGAARAMPLLDRVKMARPTRRALTRFDVAGAVAVIPRYLAGNPLAMKTQQRSATNQSPIITLVSSTSAPWHVSPDTFESAAVAALAIVDRLEDAGFRVEIIAGRRESNNSDGAADGSGANNAKGSRCEMFFRLKAAQDPLDAARVVFGIGHPAVHRRILFAAGDMHPAFRLILGEYQGYAVGLPPLDRPAGSFVLPSIAAMGKKKITDPIAAFDHAIETLRAQGCPGLED